MFVVHIDHGFLTLSLYQLISNLTCGKSPPASRWFVHVVTHCMDIVLFEVHRCSDGLWNVAFQALGSGWPE